MAFRYEFRSADGRICCSANDRKLLCDSCKMKAAIARSPETSRNERRSAREWQQHFANLLKQDVHGTPPDGYAIALAHRAIQPKRVANPSDPMDAYRSAFPRRASGR